MDATVKAKWVAALRSGEYQKGVGHLHDKDTDTYCCLGVLCKAVGAEFGPATEELEWDDEPYTGSYDYVPTLGGRVLSDKEDQELRKSFCKEVGISDQFVLIKMNDGEGNPGEEGYEPAKPFNDIADYIEENL